MSAYFPVTPLLSNNSAPRSEHCDGFIAVVVGGRDADAVVPGQLRDPGVVEQPAQRQHRLLIGAQRAGVFTGASAEPLGVQQT